MAREMISFVRDPRPPAPVALPPGSSESDGWRLLQSMLASFGVDPGPIDGIPGPRTLSAALAVVNQGKDALKAVTGASPAILVGVGLLVGVGGAALLMKRGRAS